MIYFFDLILTFAIVDGPKKPNHELNSSKIITAAASSYIAKELTFSPKINDKFKVFESSTATANSLQIGAYNKI